jgi:hypothetical protein
MHADNRNAPGAGSVRRLWAEADIDLPTTAAKSIENAPEQTFGPHAVPIAQGGG